MKKAGILMPVFSIGGRHGCGDFGKDSYRFVDMIHQCGFSIWQILPLNPLGNGNSPYMSYSSFAMDEVYISLDLLADMGLIKKAPSYRRRAKRVDYQAVRKFKEPYLKEAFKNFKPDLNYSTFSYQDWVKNYTIFTALRKKNGCDDWSTWPKEEIEFPEKGEYNIREIEEEVLYEAFLQYILFLQWKDLKQYANDRGIAVMGDIPFYVGLNSSDVWADKQNFLLDEEGHPTFIAGVPPDYFSATGQRWGNPIYDWEYMKKDHFTFWMNRILSTAKMFDLVRIDHFRAFDTYWKIKAECPTAIDGEWMEAPGYEFFDTLFAKDDDIELIAEDLGYLRDEVHQLRDHYNFRGMRVIQFSFPPQHDGPDREHLVVYTGTHDNAPVMGWYLEQSNYKKRELRSCLKRLGYAEKSFADNILSYAMHSEADMVIIPLNDFLHMNNTSRINKPGTEGDYNWTWRFTELGTFARRTGEIAKLIRDTGRNSDE